MERNLYFENTSPSSVFEPTAAQCVLSETSTVYAGAAACSGSEVKQRHGEEELQSNSPLLASHPGTPHVDR